MTDRHTDTEYATLHVEIDSVGDSIATVELSRPDSRNALNEILREELSHLLESLDSDESIRVVVLTGDPSGNAFSAGADISDLEGRTPVEHRSLTERPRVYDRVADFQSLSWCESTDTLSGGGCELALAADLRIARVDAKMGFPELTLGILPGGGGTHRLMRLVGRDHASELILTGSPIDGERAKQIGLVTRSCPTGELNGLANKIATNSPLAVSTAKRAISKSEEFPLNQGIDFEAELFAHLLGSHDAQEGLSAFLEDRNPEWEGR